MTETGDKVDTGRERQLIEAALAAATPKPGSDASFDGRADLPPPGTFPGYELVRHIHRGGQGVVYQAIQLTTKRKVAIKVMHSGPFLGSSGRARFEREVEVLGQLHHPSIVDIYDSGQTADGSFYYVMDYISGRSLDEVLESQSERPSIAETLKLFSKICDAINAAHLKGVIHRDLKPSNIRIDNTGEPVIVDFGLAKVGLASVTDETTPRLMTMTGEFIGSLPWASPEQAIGSAGGLDVRTDVYSLGVILYQMLTGKFPYQVIGNMRDVLDNILKAEPARPSTIRRQINDEVETIVLKCLSKEKERRYQSAGDLGRDIRRYLAGEPIEAKRDSGWYVLSKTLRRYSVPVSVGAGFVVMLAIFSVAMTVLYRQAEAARQAEAIAADTARTAQQEAEQERQRAQDNFLGTWELASTLGFELFDLIDNLRGATEAKGRLLEEVAAALESISVDERADDPDFQLDYARALGRLAELLGGRSLHRINDSGRAVALADQSAAILEQLRAARPDAAGVVSALAEARRRQGYLARQQRNWEVAQARYTEAMVLHDEAVGARGADAARRLEAQRQRASTLLEFGDLYAVWIESGADDAERLLGQMTLRYDEAALFWQGRAAADAADAEAARWGGVILLKRAQTELLRGRIHLGAAEDVVGDPQAKAGHVRQGIDALRASSARAAEALAALEPLAASSTASAEAARDIFLAYQAIGEAEMRSGAALADLAGLAADEAEQLREEAARADARALAAFAAGEDAARRLAASDESNLMALRDLAVALNKLARQRESAGDAGAGETYLESLRVRQDLFRNDPLPQFRSDLAVGLYRQGMHERALGEAAEGAQREVHYRAAVAYLTQAREHFEALDDTRRAQICAQRIESIQDLLGGR
ncbi:MAG: protein kinase [Phycisphaerales bacterium JB039]